MMGLTDDRWRSSMGRESGGAVPRADSLAAGSAAAAGIADISTADIERWMGWAYPRLLAEADRQELRSELCNRVAEHLQLPLIGLSRAVDGGGFVNLAQSRQTALWADLQQVPPRWDDSFAGQGPAAQALRGGQPVVVSSAHEGMALWRRALEQQRVTQVLAWPLKTAEGDLVLEFYGLAGQLDQAEKRADLRRLIEAVIRLVDDMHQRRQHLLLADALDGAGNSVFVTDLNGTIVWCNRAFSELTGYTREEVVGRNPRFLKSGQQSVRYYRDLWAVIRSGRVWNGETVDRDKNGHCYTIQQTISPVAHDGRVTHYLCLQSDISRQKQHHSSMERACRVDPATGLLTRAAFDVEAETALHDAAVQGQPMALALITLPALKTALEGMDAETESVVTASLSERIRRMGGSESLFCVSAAAEFMLLLPAPPAGAADWGAQLEALAEVLRQPVPMIDESVNANIKTALVRFPADAEALTGLRLAAERRLADEPMRPARRHLAH